MSLTSLKPFEVEQQHREQAVLGSESSERPLRAFHEATTIRKSGQGVMECLMLPAVGFVLQLVDESAVVEHDARVVRQRVEQPGVVAIEGGDIAESIADDEHADQSALGAQW